MRAAAVTLKHCRYVACGGCRPLARAWRWGTRQTPRSAALHTELHAAARVRGLQAEVCGLPQMLSDSGFPVRPKHYSYVELTLITVVNAALLSTLRRRA